MTEQKYHISYPISDSFVDILLMFAAPTCALQRRRGFLHLSPCLLKSFVPVIHRLRSAWKNRRKQLQRKYVILFVPIHSGNKICKHLYIQYVYVESCDAMFPPLRSPSGFFLSHFNVSDHQMIVKSDKDKLDQYFFFLH